MQILLEFMRKLRKFCDINAKLLVHSHDSSLITNHLSENDLHFAMKAVPIFHIIVLWLPF